MSRLTFQTAALMAVASVVFGVHPAGAQTTQADDFGVQSTQLGPMPAGISGWTISRDGRHVALVAKYGPKLVVVVDGRAGPEYDRIVLFAPARLTFDADGALEYLAVKGNTLYRVRHAPPPAR